MKISCFTRKKIHIEFFLFLFIIFFICLTIFFYLPASKTSAAGLEVEYPTLSTGASITPDSDLAQYLKYVFDFGVFAGFFAVFLSLIWAGVLYFVSAGKPDALAMAKDRVSGAISGLLILATLVLIIITINPQLSIFKLNPLEKVPEPPPVPPAPGVNFYKSQDCSGATSTKSTSIPDLGDDLANQIHSVKVISDKDTGYISILYDVMNFWGRCQYINPNANCTKVDPFAASASIHKFDFAPNGDGVYLYRKSFQNEEGGWLKITNSQIENAGKSTLYAAELSKLKFTGKSSNGDNLKNCTVPEDEQDCVKYDKNKKCEQKSCPTLAGENISSIKINGNYLVLLIHYDPSDTKEPWWTCQAFPTVNDVNKTGPNQVKWEHIRNSGKEPNYIMIIPVAQL